jgi:hypothetical protein
MFFTSAITSILPYILFLGIICTYYLGITSENLKFYKNHEASAIISTSGEYEAEHQNNQNYKYFTNTASDQFVSKSDTQFYCRDDNSLETNLYVYQINKNSQYLQFYLFSRPPPVAS